MSEVKKCPKCGGEMKKTELTRPPSLGGFWKPKRIIPYVCQECGYIEIYKEMKEKRE